MREYNKTDAIETMRREKHAAEDRQDFKAAEVIEKRIAWFRGGCRGREPKVTQAKKQFNIRLDAELRERVERIIAESNGKYRSLAHYIELAVAEKVDKEGK